METITNNPTLTKEEIQLALRHNVLESMDAVESLANTMLWANGSGLAGHDSVYGCCRAAIIEIAARQCGVNLANVDWNLGGNSSYATDIAIAIREEQDRMIEEAVSHLEARQGDFDFGVEDFFTFPESVDDEPEPPLSAMIGH